TNLLLFFFKVSATIPLLPTACDADEHELIILKTRGTAQIHPVPLFCSRTNALLAGFCAIPCFWCPNPFVWSISSVWSPPHTARPCRTTAFTCVFRCFPCDPSCGSASWATPDFSQRSVAPMVKMTRSKTFQAYLPSCHRTYSCIHCRAHLANHDELISKSFQGSQGRAYLFNSVVNVGCGPAEERVLLTGLHAVADIYCENCKTTLGWKYEHAFESSQKYKEGKYIIELAHMIKDNGWD
uniref:Yippee like 2 n=1 Tax=Junco hyemalis TaxID=40217 RepID=A0A8C5IAQ1_JUNHY